ncbi:hypothetical protein ONA70_09550 [Micromonospora yasonensis]|uniref:hypothetical protein n=1 Tax=Micromonospora yasonensis TaxID=1128667 RepID=UPI002231D2CF|nr:hypothetical protein [Micromonospora yasonensis]MCW3840340.1 hypothetical protein [Micromonospora yasonensis]
MFDHSALLAFGAGHRLLSALVVQAHRGSNRRLFVPALCLAAASARRPALGEHVGALPMMDVAELRYPGALAVGQLVKQGVDWQLAHAVVLGRPDPEWPEGRPVLTESPKAYAGLGVVTIDIG